ncbi:transposase, MuDR, MULE transposase domain protein [Tanacetum coccineum]
MASNIKNFKCLIHFNETQRGSILSEYLTYSKLHEMVMQKFNLEANAVINLSFKLSSFDSVVDITDDAEVQFFVECACNSKDEFAHLSNEYNTDDVVNENPQDKIYKWQKFMSFEPDIPETPVYKAKPNISNQYSQQSEVEKEYLTYSKLHEMVMQKFNLEANAVINLSFKLSSFDSVVDITDDAEVQFFVECACNSKDEFAHLFVSERKNNQKNMFFNFFESTTLENEGPSNQEIPSSFLNNGISFDLGQNDFHSNDSLHLQNEPHFSNPESSFDFRSNEYNTDDVVNENPQDKIHKWQKFMSFEPDIPDSYVPQLSTPHAYDRCCAFKGSIQGNKSGSYGHGWKQSDCADCFWYMQRGTCPFWSWWMSVLKECIDDKPNLLFISDRNPAIALAVQNEFPLAFHTACCRHLMMNLSLKKKKTKGHSGKYSRHIHEKNLQPT